MNFSTRFIRVLKVVYALSGLSEGMRGSTPRSYCANVAPAPLLSFSCVKKKEGGERKSLMISIRRGEADVVARGRRCVAAGFRPPTVKIEPFRTSVAASMPANAHAVAAYCLLPAPPRWCVATCCESRATDCLGAALREENRETRVDALPLPVSPA